jgi:hypothetical protein
MISHNDIIPQRGLSKARQNVAVRRFFIPRIGVEYFSTSINLDLGIGCEIEKGLGFLIGEKGEIAIFPVVIDFLYFWLDIIIKL